MAIVVRNNQNNKRPGMTFKNEQIKAARITIIDSDGVSLGTFPRNIAMAKKDESGQDLIQMNYNAKENLAVAKLMDYGKYKYNKSKEDKKKKQQQSKGMKELKISYMIGAHDLALKVKKTRELLEDGFTVRIAVKLRGRENVYKDKVIEQLHDIEKELADCAKSQGVKQERNICSVVFAAIKKSS